MAVKNKYSAVMYIWMVEWAYENMQIPRNEKKTNCNNNNKVMTLRGPFCSTFVEWSVNETLTQRRIQKMEKSNKSCS